MQLLTTTYSATSEEKINDRLEKLEKHAHRLSNIAEYLVSLKYAKARDHRDEVADFKEVLDKCSEDIFKLLHDRHAAAPVAAAPLQAAAAAVPRFLLHLLSLSLKSSPTTLLPLPSEPGRNHSGLTLTPHN